MTTLGSPATPDRHAVDIRIEADQLHITVRKEFDSGSLHQDWAHSIISMQPGPYALVFLDLSQVGLLSSTFFSGLIQLHQHYLPRGCKSIVLHQPDPRVVRNLKALRLDGLFKIEPRIA